MPPHRVLRIPRADGTGQRHQQHAQQHAAVLHPGQFGRAAGCEAEHRAGKGLENQVLRTVGEHGDKNKNREAAGGWLLPDLAQRFFEARLAGRFCRGAVSCGASHGMAFKPVKRQHGQQQRHHRHHAGNDHQALRRIGVQPMAGQTGGDGKAGNHHHPHQRGRTGTPTLGHALGQHHQQRGATGAHANTDQGESEHCQRDAGRPVAGHPDGGQRGGDAACGQHRHAADDPGRAPAANVRAVTHAGPGHLHQVVQSDQKARQERGQGQLDHHHAVQGGGGQHHNRAQAGLHQTQPGNAAPAEIWQCCAHGATALVIWRSAKALTIMPATNRGTPKPLYQSARAVGSCMKRFISSACSKTSAATAAACSGRCQ